MNPLIKYLVILWFRLLSWNDRRAAWHLSRRVVILICLAGISAFGQPPLPQMPAKAPKTATAASLSPKAATMPKAAVMAKVHPPAKPVLVFVIEWKPNADGANIATIVKTTTNLLDSPEKWQVAYVGKGTNFQWNNDWSHTRFFMAKNVFTNF